MRAVSIRAVSCAVLMLAALAGCGGGGSASSASATASVPTSVKSTQISLSGTPLGSVTAGQAYSFTPVLSNANSRVAFSIQNQPSWASFSASTGTLSGTPKAADAGTYAHIVISVSSGQTTVSLPAFSISVLEAASATGSADVSWTPPTTYTDGSTLTNLAGYNIYYGTSPASLTRKVQVTTIGLTDYVIGGLTSGTWYFAVTAYTSTGAESGLSNVASKTIT